MGATNTPLQVPLTYSFNAWTPAAGDTTGTCSLGCFITEERLTLQEINVSMMVGSFGFISGTNHLLQFIAGVPGENGRFSGIVSGERTWLHGWLENYVVVAIRNIDYAFSASMMMLCLAILFLAPFDVQTGFYIFAFQSLVQLAGYASELIRGTEITEVSTRAFSFARPIFYAAASYWLLPWTLLFYLFYVSGYSDPETQTILAPPGGNPNMAADRADPPLQVTFFLAYLFVSFGVFPVVLFFKINSSGTVGPQFKSSGSSSDVLFAWNYRYEILFGCLSAVSKLPLQLFFSLGSFNRQRIAPVTGTFGDNLEATQDDFNRRVITNSIWPSATAIVLAAVALAVFRGDLGISATEGSRLRQTGSFIWALFRGLVLLLLALLLFSVIVFFPVLAYGDYDDPDYNPMVGVNLTNVAVLLAIICFFAAQFVYGKIYNQNDSPGGIYAFLNPVYDPRR